MLQPSLNDRVRLTPAVPFLWLQCGDAGVVRSIWSSTPCFAEVTPKNQTLREEVMQ